MAYSKAKLKRTGENDLPVSGHFEQEAYQTDTYTNCTMDFISMHF
jgi:hypothetical protein